MSRKRSRHIADAPTPSKSPEPLKPLPVGLIATLLLLIPAVFFFAVGKYLELNTPGPFDSGAYTYSAQHILDGARLGVDEAASARPATLLMNVIGVKLFGYSDSGPKIIQMLLQLAALGLMFGALQRLWGRTAAVVAVTIAAFYLSAPHIAKFGNVKEQFMIAFMVIAASAWILYEKTGRLPWLLFTGAAVIWPYYFKPTGLSIAFALFVYLLYRTAVRRISLQKLLMIGLGLLAGAAAGILPLAAFLVRQGQSRQLLHSFPFYAVQLLFGVVLVCFAVRFLIVPACQGPLVKQLRQVHPRIWKLGGISIGLLLGAWVVYFAAIGELAYYGCSLFFVKIPLMVYVRLEGIYHQILQYAGAGSGYLSDSRAEYSLARQAPVVLRYYLSLAVPVFAGVLSILILLVRRVWLFVRQSARTETAAEFDPVLLLGLWWLLDMAFVWISPQPYEQYYLPLCASGAFLAGGLAWIVGRGIRESAVKPAYIATAVVLAILTLCLAWPVWAGYTISTFSGKPYGTNPYTGQAVRSRGYVQSLQRVKRNQKDSWIAIGEYIRDHSKPEDPIYVWGWVPGIYVAAERTAPVPQAFESNMHVMPPSRLAALARTLVEQFRQTPPKFIVDTRKQHFPFDRPPFELWPQIRKGGSPGDFLPSHPQAVEQYERQYGALIGSRFGAQEQERFEAMKSLRDFVMNRYKIVRLFGNHVLFEYKGSWPPVAAAESAKDQETQPQ